MILADQEGEACEEGEERCCQQQHGVRVESVLYRGLICWFGLRSGVRLLLSVSSFGVVVAVFERVDRDSSTMDRCFYRVCVVMCRR